MAEISFINPFRNVTKSEEEDDKRGLALRSSFTQKLKSTFDIFSGSYRFYGFGFQNAFDPPNYPILKNHKLSHLGLWDYATFGIPWAIGALWHLVATKLYLPLKEKNNTLTFNRSSPMTIVPFLGYRVLFGLLNLINLPLTLLHLALELTRLAGSLALTVIAFFPVLAVHGISQAIRSYKIHKIEALEVEGADDKQREPLSTWLTKHHLTIENIIKSRSKLAEQKILFTPTSESTDQFYLPLFKLHQTHRQEGLEDLADLSVDFNTELSKTNKK